MSIKAGVPTFGRRPWMRTLFRWFVTVAAALTFAQAALAGAFLSGHYGALSLHSVNANIALLASLGAAAVGVLIWRPGRGEWWPAAVSGGVFLAEGLQVGFGYARSISIHVPLGVAVITGLVVLTLRVWRPTGERVEAAATAPGVAP